MELELKQGKVAHFDDEDWALVGRHKWHSARWKEGCREWWYALAYNRAILPLAGEFARLNIPGDQIT